MKLPTLQIFWGLAMAILTLQERSPAVRGLHSLVVLVLVWQRGDFCARFSFKVSVCVKTKWAALVRRSQRVAEALQAFSDLCLFVGGEKGRGFNMGRRLA